MSSSSSKTKQKPETEECVKKCPGGAAKQSSLVGTTINSTPCGSDKNLTYLSNTLPFIPSRPARYTPMPYIFRIPYSSLYAPIKNGLVKCPPFYLQLDHALAVIWSLFTKSNVPKELGIVQLQWALGFFRNVRNTKGEYTRDVQVCIQAIEDQLLELYADMVNELNKVPKRKKSCSSCCKKSGSATSTGSGIDENVSMKQNYIKKQIPFSINYVELLKKNPQLRPIITKPQCVPSKSCTSVENQTPKPQETTQMVDFLNSWRSEQIKKIEAELKRLHSIETFIESANKSNFQPYLEDTSMSVLGSKKCPPNKCPGDKKQCDKKSCDKSASK